MKFHPFVGENVGGAIAEKGKAQKHDAWLGR